MKQEEPIAMILDVVVFPITALRALPLIATILGLAEGRKLRLPLMARAPATEEEGRARNSGNLC
jgi:hypothetical protein